MLIAAGELRALGISAFPFDPPESDFDRRDVLSENVVSQLWQRAFAGDRTGLEADWENIKGDENANGLIQWELLDSDIWIEGIQQGLTDLFDEVDRCRKQLADDGDNQRNGLSRAIMVKRYYLLAAKLRVFRRSQVPQDAELTFVEARHFLDELIPTLRDRMTAVQSVAPSAPAHHDKLDMVAIRRAAGWWDRTHEWMEVARDGVDDIRGWRDALDRRAKTTDPREMWDQWNAEEFHHLTLSLTSSLAQEYPQLDPTPLHDIYKWLAAWYGEHSDRELPQQTKLDRTFETAVLVLGGPRGKAFDGLQTGLAAGPMIERVHGLPLCAESKPIDDSYDALKSVSDVLRRETQNDLLGRGPQWSGEQKRRSRLHFRPDSWLPLDVCQKWKSNIYPRHETRESVASWKAKLIEEANFTYINLTIQDASTTLDCYREVFAQIPDAKLDATRAETLAVLKHDEGLLREHCPQLFGSLAGSEGSTTPRRPTEPAYSLANAPEKSKTKQGTTNNPTVLAAFRIIKAAKGNGHSAKEIIKQLRIQKIIVADSTFRKHVRPELTRLGVKNHRSRGGYYLDADECSAM